MLVRTVLEEVSQCENQSIFFRIAKNRINTIAL